MNKFKKLLCIAGLTYIEWNVINDYIDNDPLLENNLNKTLDLINEEIRLSTPMKSIWLYTGYTWNQIMNHHSSITDDFDYIEESYIDELFKKRKQIVSQCDVLVDGKYIESKRDITLKWRGSSNQNVIDIQKSLQKKEMVLWCN